MERMVNPSSASHRNKRVSEMLMLNAEPGEVYGLVIAKLN